MGAPKKRLMWLDIGDPNTPVLVWQDGDVLDRARVKDKDRMSLIDIIDIKAGQVSAPLRRSGRVQHADKYLSFTAEDRTFDVEAATVEGRDWLFKKFADLFQAYATAKIEGRQGDSATLRVSELMDGGAAAAAAAANDVGSPRGRGYAITEVVFFFFGTWTSVEQTLLGIPCVRLFVVCFIATQKSVWSNLIVNVT